MQSDHSGLAQVQLKAEHDKCGKTDSLARFHGNVVVVADIFHQGSSIDFML